MPPNSEFAPARRVRGLDMLRGAASLMVCWFHLTAFDFETPGGAFYDLLRASARYGWVGVEMFFVISGLVIPYSLHRAGYRLRDYPIFLLKRVVRLDPPYLVTIALILCVYYWQAEHAGAPFMIEGTPVTWERVLLHLGYLNTFRGGAWLNPVFWTLAIEFQYYLLIGLAFPLFGSARRRVRLAALAAAGLLCLLFAGWAEPGMPGSRFFLKFTFLFLMGILTFQYLAEIIGRGEYVALMPAAVAGCYLTVGPPSALAAVVTAAAAVLYDRRGRVDVFFGKISYSLYLLHWLVGPVALSVASSRLVGKSGDGWKVAALAIALAACLVAAYLLYALVERPSQRWSSRMRYKGEAEAGRRRSAEAAGL